jgi:C-terminal processing protease CtpA/Prc
MRSAALRKLTAGSPTLRSTAPAAVRDHGVARVTRLAGRAGYLELTTFECGAAARHAFRAALDQLADARAVILDLRRHRGGEESMASFVTSCFFATEPMPRERFTADPLPAAVTPSATRLLTAALDVLVSRDTSILGRAFAENLERLGRARIVGPLPRRVRSIAQGW